MLRLGFTTGVLLGVLSWAGAPCVRLLIQTDEPTMSTLQFLQSRRERRYPQVPRKVLAFYYTWYGTPERHGRWIHWERVDPARHDIASSTHYPALGAYDSYDPQVIDRHIAQAQASGVDAFICTWWGQRDFHDGALRVVLGRAEQWGFEVTLYWETVPGQGQAKIERAVDDLVYMLKQYGDHPAFLKLNGSPVIFVYGRVMGQVAMEEWPAIISRARAQYGKDFLLIADGYQESFARLFDGVHTYNICGWVQGKTPLELRRLSRTAFHSAVQLAKQHGKIACITVIPGYDDTKIRTPGINAERLDGATYQVLWEQAIEADPDWVLITSWNEWHEGSEIEPSDEYGDQYLHLTGQYAPRFKRTPYSRVPIPERPGGADLEKAAALRALYAGKTIALLPDFSGEAAFWLADTGVALRELTWEDLVDRARFNAGRFPIALFAGTEHYTQSVRRPGDVDDAIRRYLGEGGLLMVLPSMPFPFYYNEKGDAVVSAARLGVPVQQGWESPPAGVQLRFEINRVTLPELTATAPFPAAGDQRWRPARPQGLAEGDLYLPLARLRDDQGNLYGEGIVYLEHRTGDLKGGKVLYAWMRMAEVVGADALFSALFRLAAEKAQTPIPPNGASPPD